MMDYIITTLAVMTGTLVATGLMLAVVLNKKVIKAYVKHVDKVSKEITEEMIDKL